MEGSDEKHGEERKKETEKDEIKWLRYMYICHVCHLLVIYGYVCG